MHPVNIGPQRDLPKTEVKTRYPETLLESAEQHESKGEIEAAIGVYKKIVPHFASPVSKEASARLKETPEQRKERLTLQKAREEKREANA